MLLDNDDKDAAFAGEVTGDLNEEPKVVVVAGVETGRCEIRRAQVVAAVHLLRSSFLRLWSFW